MPGGREEGVLRRSQGRTGCFLREGAMEAGDHGQRDSYTKCWQEPCSGMEAGMVSDAS